MKTTNKHTVQMAKRGAHLHLKHSGKRSSVIPNKKAQAAKKFCRGS